MRANHANFLLGTAMGLPETTLEFLANMKDREASPVYVGNRAFVNLLDTTIYNYLYRADSVFALPEGKYKESIRILQHRP